MTRRMIQLALMLFATAIALGGCTHAVQADNPATIDQSAYKDAFEGAVETLRQSGFRIARNDYRFGVITTYPKEAATLAEPWVGDHTTRAQARRATLNAERREVIVTFKPGFDIDQALDAQGTDGLGTGTDNGSTYQVTIEVEVQRRREPQRFLTHSAGGYITRQYSAVPMHLQDRGIEGTYWQPIGRDTQLEQRLMAQILGSNTVAP